MSLFRALVTLQQPKARPSLPTEQRKTEAQAEKWPNMDQGTNLLTVKRMPFHSAR